MTPNDGYDIVGDVQGHADKLTELLAKLEYQHVDGVWKHPVRRAVLVGDLIDRGPKQVETVEIVRAMVDSGAARIVLGNHEFNAVVWHTPDPDRPNEFLRPYSVKNRQQHKEFLDQIGEGSNRHHQYVRWFMTLPLWLGLGELRVVHARSGISELLDHTDRFKREAAFHGHAYLPIKSGLGLPDKRVNMEWFKPRASRTLRRYCAGNVSASLREYVPSHTVCRLICANVLPPIAIGQRPWSPGFRRSSVCKVVVMSGLHYR